MQDGTFIYDRSAQGEQASLAVQTRPSIFYMGKVLAITWLAIFSYSPLLPGKAMVS